ncbi:hypothetical protein FPV67DRAFT_1666625 [Lyophyllum atratum]|nr:hypothetical protein FPV67DRAFT_1666625 [Lyophyllum atratum]
MKFFSIVAASLVVFAGLVMAAPEAVEVSASDFSKRACVPSECVCNKVQGQFCGTSTINPSCVKGHVYECSTSGTACDYGLRNSCAKCNNLTC